MTRNKVLRGDERTSVAAELADLYEAGSTIRSIAARTGRPYGVVHALLVEAGTRLRTRGGGIRKTAR